MNRNLALFLFLAWTGLGLTTAGASIYVAQNGQGANTGADAADARSLAWLNNPANWGSQAGQVGPGTTVYLLGTFTNTLALRGSGTPGSPITLYFGPSAMFSAPTLPAGSSWLSTCGLSNIVIDGGGTGILQLTDNGTLATNGGAMDYDNSGVTGIYAIPSYNITIQNLVISNLYNRQTNMDYIQGAMGDANGIYWTGCGLTVSNCFLTGCQEMIACLYQNPAGSNLTLVNCTLSNYNHGFVLGSGGVSDPVFYNVNLIHNTFQAGDMYEEHDGIEMGLHRNAIFLFNESPNHDGCVSNIVIAYNYIKHGFHPQGHGAGTGALYFDAYNNMVFQHTRVYNNISTLAYPLAFSGGGGLICAEGTDCLVANNTAIMWQSNGIFGNCGIGVCGTNANCFNNLVVSGSGSGMATFIDSNYWNNSISGEALAMRGVSLDYNVYNGQNTSSFVFVVMSAGSSSVLLQQIYDTFYQFTNTFSPPLGFVCEPHSLTSPVQLDSNWIPLSSDTVAVGNGTNLTAWGITNDYAGNPRPATGNWTIGAYQTTDSTGSNVFSGMTSAGGGSAGGMTNFTAVLTGSAITNGYVDVTNGLLVWWKFADASGASATDSSGNRHGGYLSGTTGWTNGLAGTGAVRFPTNDGGLNSPDAVVSAACPYTGDWTVTLWVNNSSFPGVVNQAAGFGGYTALFSRYQGKAWGLQDPSGLVRYYANTTLQCGGWYFLAVTKSSGTNYQFYLNGVPDGTAVASNIAISSLTVGGNGSGASGMVGAVADFRVFNRVLAGSEISTLMGNGPDNVAATLLMPPANLRIIGVSAQ